MIDSIRNLIRLENDVIHEISGISVVTVSDKDRGLDLAKKILYENVTQKTVLYLSGGRTPKELYTVLASEEKIHPGAVSLIDERYGKSFHAESNELMLRDSGFLKYLSMRDIPFFKILKGLDRKVTAEEYDQKIRELIATYTKHIAILGIGLDGHTAGLPSDPGVWEEFEIAEKSKTEMVVQYDDYGKFYNQRITTSFLALSMMDLLVVLVFGKDKQRALEWMFADGSEDEVPSRFFKRRGIAVKTILITDLALF